MSIGVPGNNRAEHEPWDAQRYTRLQTYWAFQAYTYFDGDKTYREQQKEAFLSGQSTHPILDYPQIDRDDLATKERELQRLHNDIEQRETNQTIRDAYIPKIQEKINEIQLIYATDQQDMEKFLHYTTTIYGTPRHDVFAYTLWVIQQKAQDASDQVDTHISAAGERILELLPNSKSVGSLPTIPSPTTLQQIRQITTQQVEELLWTQPPHDAHHLYTAEYIAQKFKKAMEKINAEGWKVTIDTKTSADTIRVSHATKEATIPASRAVPRDKLQGLIAHEIGTHIKRGAQGEKSKLQILSLWLHNYERGEEGIATLREKIITKPQQIEIAGEDRHFAISLAIWVDGVMRTIREVYSIMEAYYYLEELQQKPHLDHTQAQKNAIEEARKCIIRIYRGTDCATPWVCFTKDIIYREGNLDLRALVANQPDILHHVNTGKFDPTNPQHIAIMQQLGMFP